MINENNQSIDYHALARQIKVRAQLLGFQDLRIAPAKIDQAEERLFSWLDQGMHGDMAYMQNYGIKRTQPTGLIKGTQRVLCARMDYRIESHPNSWAVLQDSGKAYISRYALGRDYHKVIRKRLQSLACWIDEQITHWQYRVFCDSAPVMEKPLAEMAGLGWIGKHSNLVNAENGSWFFLGEIYTDLPLPLDRKASGHCGSCRKCIDICPTQAIVKPYVVDARRCLSYLTIENRGVIPNEFRKAMGNRIYGCDDCQLVCPFNGFSRISSEDDFNPRHGLADASLLELFAWSEAEFDHNTKGSAIRRIGYECWLRNIAVALGNADSAPDIRRALQQRLDDPSALVRGHVRWALQEQADDT